MDHHKNKAEMEGDRVVFLQISFFQHLKKIGILNKWVMLGKVGATTSSYKCIYAEGCHQSWKFRLNLDEKNRESHTVQRRNNLECEVSKGQLISRLVHASICLKTEPSLYMKIRIWLHKAYHVCSWYEDRFTRLKVKGYFVTLFCKDIYCSKSTRALCYYKPAQKLTSVSHFLWGEKKQHLHVGVQCGLKAKWKNLVPSMSTSLMKMNQFQYTQGEGGISCFGNLSWCNLYGRCPCKHWVADMGVFSEENTAPFACVAPHRELLGLAALLGASCSILHPRQGQLWC